MKLEPVQKDPFPSKLEVKRFLVRWVIVSVLAVLSAVVMQFFWQFSMTEVFNLPELKFYQALSFVLLYRAWVGFPFYSKTIQRIWHRQQNLRMEAVLQQLFMFYFEPRKRTPQQQPQEQHESKQPDNEGAGESA